MCVFCDIVAGKIPAAKIYEDETCLAFLDIAPVTPGHILVIPKKHYADMETIPAADLAPLILVVKNIGALVKDRLGALAYNVNLNNGEASGQVVSHLHFHIIPRYGRDNLELWPSGAYAAGDQEEILRKLTARL
jgi:histidine triad (HIT) family protein